MSLSRLIIRGIRSRIAQAVVVVLLAALATATAVASPAYVSVAHQSLLTDAFDVRPQASNGARFEMDVETAGLEPGEYDDLLAAVEGTVARQPGLDPLARMARYAQLEIMLPDTRFQPNSQLSYRDGACEHVELIAGQCPKDTGAVMISKRTAKLLKLEVGGSFEVSDRGNALPTTETATIAGIYQPLDESEAYWGSQNPFTFGGTEPPTVDTMFAASPASVGGFAAKIDLGVDYQVVVPKLRGVSSEQLGTDLQIFATDKPGNGFDKGEVRVRSQIPDTLETAVAQQDAVSVTIPVVMVPLLLLCWFTLYLTVARLSEDRAPQLALAKLRGHRLGAVLGLGSGEAIALILVALLPGCLLGWGLVELAARTSLAPGSSVSLTPITIGYLAVSLAGSIAAVMAACLPVTRRPVLALLRRVPGGVRNRPGMAEGAVLALAAVVVWQVLSGSGTGAVSLVATPVLALATGLAAAALLSLWTRWRLRVAVRRGRLAALLTTAQLSRRAKSRRTVVLVSVATAVVAFGVCSWGVSDTNRELAAADELGADRVYTLSEGVGAQRLIDTVEELDPSGEHVMAAMRYFNRDKDQNFATVAVQSDRLAEVARWRDLSGAELANFEKTLHPKRPTPPQVTGELKLSATVDELSGPDSMSLIAKVVGSDGLPADITLGRLKTGEQEYQGEAADCAEGCRLLGLGVLRHAGDDDPAAAELTVTGLRDAEGAVDAGFADCDRWRAPAVVPETWTAETGCADGLNLRLASRESAELLVTYASTPKRLPAAVAGTAPGGDTRFTVEGQSGQPQAFTIARSVDVVPRGGTTGMLVDLDYLTKAGQPYAAAAESENTVLEVWANDSADTDLPAQLAAAGFVVSGDESRAEQLERLSRGAPAIALRLSLLAAFAAVALVLGVVTLTALSEAAERSYDSSALAVVGVKGSVLRRATAVEQTLGLLAGVGAGIVAGAVALVLVLPRTPLVSLDAPLVPVDYSPGVLWPAVGLSSVLVAVVAAGWLVVRVGGRLTGADRLRDGVG